MIRAGAFAIMLAVTPALALAPAEQLKNPAQEQRAREISAELRCLVCQNQSIDDSDAELAKDLRRIVRERIAAGDSNAAVKTFLVDRYGEFVLLRPIFSMQNALLWLAPLLALLAGIFMVRRFYRDPAAEPAAESAGELTAAERQDLDRLLRDRS